METLWPGTSLTLALSPASAKNLCPLCSVDTAAGVAWIVKSSRSSCFLFIQLAACGKCYLLRIGCQQAARRLLGLPLQTILVVQESNQYAVCVCVRTITFELNQFWLRYLTLGFISSLSRSNLKVKVTYQSSRSQDVNKSSAAAVMAVRG